MGSPGLGLPENGRLVSKAAPYSDPCDKILNPAKVMRPIAPVRWIAPLVWLTLAACVDAGAAGQAPSSTPTDKISPSVALAAHKLIQGLPLDGLPARSDAKGNLEVYVYVTGLTPENLAALAAKGLMGSVPSPGMGVVQGWVKPVDLAALSALPCVSRITLPRYALTR